VADLNLLNHFVDFDFALELKALLQETFEQTDQRVFHVQLDEAEFFVALVFEDFPEQADVVVLLDVKLDAVDHGCCPFNDQVFQSIALVQVCVHVLLHRLSRQLIVLALFVEFELLLVDVVDHVLELLQTERSLHKVANGSLPLALDVGFQTPRKGGVVCTLVVLDVRLILSLARGQRSLLLRQVTLLASRTVRLIRLLVFRVLLDSLSNLSPQISVIDFKISYLLSHLRYTLLLFFYLLITIFLPASEVVFAVLQLLLRKVNLMVF
jgi:hypothetical protein